MKPLLIISEPSSFAGGPGSVEAVEPELKQGVSHAYKFGNNHELQKINILLVRKFLRGLTEAGIDVPGGI